MTIAADPVAPNISYEGLLLTAIDKDEKVASSKKHTQFKTRVLKPDTLFMTKAAEKPYPLGPHIPI